MMPLGLPNVPIPKFIAPALSLGTQLATPQPNKFGFFNPSSLGGFESLAGMSPFGTGSTGLEALAGLSGGGVGGTTPTMPSVNISNTYSNPFTSTISMGGIGQGLPEGHKPGQAPFDYEAGAPYGKAGDGSGDGGLKGLDINYINRMLGGKVPAGYKAIGIPTSIPGSGFNNPFAGGSTGGGIGNAITGGGTSGGPSGGRR